MKPSRTSFAVLLAFTALIGSAAIAQPCFLHSFDAANPLINIGRGKEVIQDSEFEVNDKAKGNFFCNPLVLNNEALDYDRFALDSKGELTLIKGSNGKVIEIPFNIYLRRNGKIVRLPNDKGFSPVYFEFELSEILKFAKEGDQLIIEPTNKEDWQAKRILKLVKSGC
jgi:hypothetical protein